MSKEEEIQLAWTIWHLMARLNEMISNRYENELIELYLKLEGGNIGKVKQMKTLYGTQNEKLL